jgi:hypothetical protein
MIESSCHCGAAKLEILDVPEEVTDCHCSICRRYAALWAYYSVWADIRDRRLRADPDSRICVRFAR